MFFYDILYLYKRYEQHVTEENEQYAERQAEYEMSREEPKIPDYSNIADKAMNSVGKFDANSIAKGYMNGIPKIG